ncbi:hypothetical protein CHS0354_003165 [Potamilus streckersoni]|uniref:Uncharacterized protein n=1 Tax=Potamilus streckersoni TaxID=2493646 RepID=A0AAE0T257_9BIVA|nr:hypothetical protein CHS0354_003165 [Potamilus streckersoni]
MIIFLPEENSQNYDCKKRVVSLRSVDIMIAAGVIANKNNAACDKANSVGLVKRSYTESQHTTVNG